MTQKNGDFFFFVRLICILRTAKQQEDRFIVSSEETNLKPEADGLHHRSRRCPFAANPAGLEKLWTGRRKLVNAERKKSPLL